MMLFRSAHNQDLEKIFELAQGSGIGITTLPKDKTLLKTRLRHSSLSFKTDIQQPMNEYYFFVLEDPENNHLVGTSAIEAKTGYDSPFYSYKLSKRTRICHALNIRTEYDVLSLVNDYQGYSEICTLYLAPEYRHHHNGLLLSKARFLFMAEFPQRFADNVIADMRGISDEEGVSPFWNNIGRHFFKLSFREADALTISDKQFIADLMPRNPIYVPLLSPEAQAVIGQPHETTKPAMNILFKEGFIHNHYVDIFDAGPTIEAPRKDIKTFAQSQTLVIKQLSDEVSSPEYLMAKPSIHFRATLDFAILHEDGCIISKQAAELLQVKLGDPIRIAPLK